MKSLDVYLPSYEFWTRHEVAVLRRKFVGNWRIVRPFSSLIRSQVLRAAKRRAEAAP